MTPRPDSKLINGLTPDQAHHCLSIALELGVQRLHVHCHLTAPWTLLFGPSGAGKTTVLRAAAGLLPGPGVTFDRRNSNGEWCTLQSDVMDTAPHRRSLAWAPQQASLFPHFTVLENIQFGAACATRSTARNLDPASGTDAEPEDPRELVERAVEIFQLRPLLTRKPAALSGGEAQRVNLARALATPNCRLLLLDEPFAGTDRTLRDELLPRTRAWLQERGIPVLSVSHDVDEALQLEADVILFHEGRIAAHGPAHAVLAAERERMLQTLAVRV